MAKVAGKNDYDLKKAWEDACDAFAKTTGEQLSVKTKYTPEEVLEQIRAKQEKDEEKAAKYRVVKDVLSKTLDCIDNLGNIAAQGASMVFGPAGFAGNALSYLIATGAKYKYIFNSLAELFTKISDFLERFKIYFRMPDVDVSLRVIINELLICFVSICGLSIKILKGNKALLYLKVFAFSDDAGVTAKLGELAALVEKEREMRATLSYEVDKNIERSVHAGRSETKEGFRALNSAVNEMAELEKKREASTVQAKQLESIEKAFSKPSDSYKSIYQNFIDKKVEGTGEWLQQNSMYTSWVKQEPGTSSILCLAGGEGYGKSFLTSIAVQDVRKRYPQSDGVVRTSVAYYFFQREAKSSKSEKDVLSLNNALKSLAWQIAKVDTVYRKELHTACESVEDTEVIDTWNALFENAFRSEATFYLLLDGIDQMEEKHVKALSQVLQQAMKGPKDTKERGPLCVRILISGRSKTIEELTAGTAASVIELASNNKDDVDKFIREGIANIRILSGTTIADQARRDEIFEALTKNAKGDFISVDLLLKQIAEKRRTAEMLQVLEDFQGENRSDTIARTLEGLNKSLSRQDILDLNELLAWVIASVRVINLGELDTILRMKNGEDNYSLQPLAESISERYSKLLIIYGEPDPVTKLMPLTASVEIISDSIEEYFANINSEKEESTLTALQNASKQGDVNESEVKIVRRFLESVCDPDLFKKFQFEQFFESKLTTNTAVIHFDKDDAALRIVSTCVDGLCSTDEKWLPLVDYMSDYWHRHLEVVDLSLTLPKDKTAIGAKILKCFFDKDVIERWWTDNRLWMLQWSWLDTNVFTDNVLNWFKDSAVVKGLSEDEKQWAKDLTSNSRPDADILEHIAKHLASKWLRDSYWGIDTLVLFLHGFICKIEKRKDPKNEETWKQRSFLEDIPVEHIQLILDWAKSSLGIDKLSYHEYRNLARTYRECGDLEKAIEMFKEAANMIEDNWLCRWGLSVTYGKMKNYKLAIETLEGVISSIKSGESKESDPQSELTEMQRELAQYTRDSGDTAKAIEMYQSMIKENLEDYDTALEFLTYLSEGKHYTHLAELISLMKATVDKNSGFDRWTTFYHEYAQYSVYHETLANAGNDEGYIQLVRDGYENAVEAVKTKQKLANATTPTLDRDSDLDTMSVLLYYFGVFLYRTQCVEDATSLAVTLWQQVLAMGVTFTTDRKEYFHYSMSSAREDMAWAYLRIALDSGPESAVTKECIQKLQDMITEVKSEWYYDGMSSSQALARYYAATGQQEQAREVMKSEVKINLELLSDEDPDNDFLGYRGLACCFMFAGEFEQAEVAWSLITPLEVDGELPDEEDKLTDGDKSKEEAVDEPQEPAEKVNGISPELKSETDKPDVAAEVKPTEGEPESEPEPNAKPNGTTSEEGPNDQPFAGPMGLRCDGRCGSHWSYADDFYCCLECADVQFDIGCLKKHRDGTLHRRVCNKKHEMFYVKKYDPKRLKEIGKGNVDMGGKVISVKEWLNEVRKLWGIESVA